MPGGRPDDEELLMRTWLSGVLMYEYNLNA